MYCSINEAWPNHQFQNNRMSKFEHFDNNQQSQQPIQQPIQQTQQTQPIQQPIQQPQSIQSIQQIQPTQQCYSIIEHIESCPYCKNYIMRRYGSNRLFELLNVNPQLKETISVFLIGIIILLILNVFYKTN